MFPFRQWLDGVTDVNRLVRTLLHPRLLMSALGLLSLYTGMVSLTIYSSAYLHYPAVWGAIGTLAGVAALSAAWHPSRTLVSLAGAALVVAFASRSVGIAESLITLDQITDDVAASFSIATVQWATMGYVTFAVFRRLIVPWAAMEREVNSGR